MDLIQQLEQEEIARLGKNIPAFAPGDTVVVSVNVVEGERKRVQAYEGVVIAKRNRGLNSSFIVRKVSSGEGVERTFQTYSPIIANIEVKRRGEIDGVEQLVRYIERLHLDSTLGQVRGVFVAQVVKPQARVLAESRGFRVVEVDYDELRGMKPDDLRLF